MGFKVFTMNNSKFDDYDRNLFREIGKAIMYSPYNGVIAAGERSKDYMRFLGFPERRICMNSNVLSVERIRSAAENDPAGNQAPQQPATEKLAPESVGYQPTPNDWQKCLFCTYFQAPKTCAIVAGTVTREGWCTRFVLLHE